MMTHMEMDRRTLIAGAGALAVPALAALEGKIDLGFENGGRALAPRFPQKGEMIVQRVRPPLLETPFSVFDSGTITPNDRHFVRWSGGAMPNFIDVTAHRLTVHGAVKSPLSLSLAELLRAGEHVEVVAVNQCAGNSRGFSEPRVPGAQWGHGAMSNARWTGVRLRDLLDKAGIGGDAKRVRFKGLDVPAVDGSPQKIKSIPIDVARRDEVLIAFAMNGEALPLLNGFPLRIVVPGWFATYWVKMLSDIEVLNTDEDDSYFMARTYRMPAPGVTVKPGDKDFPTVPITTMGPRSFVTSHRDGTSITAMAAAQGQKFSGIAFGGDCGVAKVDLLVREGTNARTVAATLESDDGQYGCRRWAANLSEFYGHLDIGVRCTNANGVVQPDVQAWNPSGYARNVVERITLRVA
jgi:DMSO/TMAO reductase YedYZ molybdopterin-dependent catalytic subunit